jgi:hypothetical protein
MPGKCRVVLAGKCPGRRSRDGGAPCSPAAAEAQAPDCPAYSAGLSSNDGRSLGPAPRRAFSPRSSGAWPRASFGAQPPWWKRRFGTTSNGTGPRTGRGTSAKTWSGAGAMPAELPAAAIADAGPIIHLDELGCCRFWVGFVKDSCPTSSRWRRIVTVQREGHGHPQVTAPNRRPRNACRTSCAWGALDVGEAAALALWRGYSTAVLLCDVLAARQCAEGIGCAVTGTRREIGLLAPKGRRSRMVVSSQLSG